MEQEKKQSLVDILTKRNEQYMTKEEFLQAFEELVNAVQTIRQENGNAVSNLEQTYESLKQKVQDDYSVSASDLKDMVSQETMRMMQQLEEKISHIDQRLLEVKDGEDSDPEQVMQEVLKRIPEQKDVILDNGVQIRDKLEALQDDDRLDKTAIKGLEEFDAVVEQTKKGARIIHGPLGMQLYIDGVKKGWIKTLDFVSGTGIAIAYSKVNGLDTLTFNASGVGVTVSTPAETPNGVITAFTAVGTPKWVVADGITYYAGAGYSYSAPTVTMSIPPSSTIRIIT